MRRIVKTVRLGALAVLCVAAAACQSPLGSISPSLVELYDAGSEGGVIEIEAERSGEIIEMEADIPIADLPEVVVAAARRHAPGLEITGAEREIKPVGTTWEVKGMLEGRDWEFVIDGAGSVVETEKSLTPEEAPAAVLAAAERAIPRSDFKSVEIISHTSGHQEYHVKRTRNGASYKVVLHTDGRIIRKVREHRAEIEIPLLD